MKNMLNMIRESRFSQCMLFGCGSISVSTHRPRSVGSVGWKTIGQFFRKLEIALPQDPAYTTPGYIIKRCPSIQQGQLLNYVQIVVIFIRDRNKKTTQMFLSERIDKENVVHLCGRILNYSAIKSKVAVKSARNWMELENVILSDITQNLKDMHGVFSLINGYQPQSTG